LADARLQLFNWYVGASAGGASEDGASSDHGAGGGGALPERRPTVRLDPGDGSGPFPPGVEGRRYWGGGGGSQGGGQGGGGQGQADADSDEGGDEEDARALEAHAAATESKGRFGEARALQDKAMPCRASAAALQGQARREARSVDLGCVVFFKKRLYVHGR
jgi:hypothetical protein